MSIGFTFSACSFFYILLLNIVFFSKKRLKTLENKIYSILIITSLCGVSLALGCYFTIMHTDTIPFINMIVSKALLVYYVVYLILFTLYIYVISKKISYENRNKNLIISVVTIFILLLSLISILPLYFYHQNSVCYSYGPSANLVYFVSGIAIFIWIVLMIQNYKELKDKKYLPIFMFIILGTIVMIIQKMNPGLLLMTSMEAFVTFLMYFTIENPDMKLIKELNVAKDQAEKANNAKSEFLSSMSHEIRTPLNAIVGFSQALLEEDINDQARDEVEDIVLASNSLLEIINGILDISKIESGKIEIINKEYHFKDIFDELVILSRGRLGDKALDFRIHYDESIPNTLYGDYTRVKQVILNILTNAIKYTKEGYIDFTVSSVIKNDICRLIISVEDSGIGIKQEKIPLLFQKFERVDLEKNITIEGTGLGLAITKKLVELMDGKIVVQSIYGKGSKFTIAIDQRIIHKEVEKETSHDEDKVDVEKIAAEGKKVLVIDDNKINLKVAARLLQGYQLVITSCDSGFDAIDKINGHEEFDLILLDDMMPKMSGVETLKKLKEIDGFNIPVVALTANAISGMREKYLSEGFDDYLAKPIDKEELARIVAKYLSK